MSRSRNIGCVGAVFSVWLFPAVALAQNSGIAGVVKDASGAVLPGVTVEAASPALIEKVRSVVTDGQGLYSIVALRPGTYSVTFTLTGFSTVKREGVELSGSFTAEVNAELKVGAVEETITVTSEVPLVDTRNVVEVTQLDDAARDVLPNGRSALFMALTIPGMTNTGGIKGTGQDVLGASDTRGSSFIHGGRSGDYRLEMDGLYLNTTAVQVNPGDVQQFVYKLGALSAQNDADGVRVSLIPKEGGNRYTGTLYGAYIAGESSNLTPGLIAQGIPTPNSYIYDHDYNASGGGPIKRDKLWFFASYRYFADDQQVAGMFFAINPQSFTYNPSLGAAGNVNVSEPAYNLGINKWYDGRLTWQASEKNKLALYWSEQPRQTDGTFVTGTVAMEAGRTNRFPVNDIIMGSWKSPVTNKLLFEVSYVEQRQIGPQGPPSFLPNLESSDIASVTDTGTGYSYRASPTGYTYTYTHQPSTTATASYITGAHALKVGVAYEWGLYNETGYQYSDNQTYTFHNGVPTSVTDYNTPYSQRPEYTNWGVYAQDQWTLKRMTMNLGVRFSDHVGSIGAGQVTGPNQFEPLQTWPTMTNVPNWKDISPRLGLAYDLFGNGKTSLKGAWGRYVINDYATGFPLTVDPIFANLSATQSWTEAYQPGSPNYYIPEPSELGKLSNSAFGTATTTTTVNPNIQQGWYVRPYEDEWQVGIQHQLTAQVSVNFNFIHREYYNLQITDNLALNPSDYNQFCVTAPIDPRLGSVSGNQICGLYDLNPSFLHVTPQNLITMGSNYGTDSEIYKGIDVGINARLLNRITLSGGLNDGPQTNNTSSCFVYNSPQALRFCQTQYPWLPSLRLHADVNLPWGFNTAVSFQSIPGPPVIANFTVTNASIASGQAEFLDGRTSFASGSSTVSLLAPGAAYSPRLEQLDIRLARSFVVKDVKARPTLDVGNVFNVSTVLTQNNAYGAAWLRPAGESPPGTPL